MLNTQDLGSSGGIQTRIWGPSLWFFLHCMSVNYPVHPSRADKVRHLSFLLSLGGVLPCGYCRESFLRNLYGAFKACGSVSGRLVDQPAFKDRESFFTLLWHLHAIVSRSIGKTDYVTPVRDVVRATYESFRSRCLTPREQEQVTGEKGCTEPLWGRKGQCRVNVVPLDGSMVTQNITVDPACVCTRNL